MNDIFIDVGVEQICKNRQSICGDNFVSKRIEADGRTICVLADGLGSGIKASVLATLCSSMAIEFMNKNADITRAAKTIMDTLPVCQLRKISYSTFTIISIDHDNEVSIIEYDNPTAIIFNLESDPEIVTDKISIKTKQRNAELIFTKFTPRPEDRIIFCSDGVTQAGMGTSDAPLGWGDKKLFQFVKQSIDEENSVCARDLAKKITLQAHQLDNYMAKDDISCAAIYFRSPRKTAVFTGPPTDRSRDALLWDNAINYRGKKIICGGTTAEIMARESGKPLELDLGDLNSLVPPKSTLTGFDLVTEGTITLGHLISLFKNPSLIDDNAAGELYRHLIDSDKIDFFVGTKINEAHQDPNLPQELELRRNLIKRIKYYLEKKHLKSVTISYI